MLILPVWIIWSFILRIANGICGYLASSSSLWIRLWLAFNFSSLISFTNFGFFFLGIINFDLLGFIWFLIRCFIVSWWCLWSCCDIFFITFSFLFTRLFSFIGLVVLSLGVSFGLFRWLLSLWFWLGRFFIFLVAIFIWICIIIISSYHSVVLLILIL